MYAIRSYYDRGGAEREEERDQQVVEPRGEAVARDRVGAVAAYQRRGDHDRQVGDQSAHGGHEAHLEDVGEEARFEPGTASYNFV